MQKRLAVLFSAVALVAVALGIPAGIATATSDSSFSATVNLVQTDLGAFVPGPGTLANIQGERFEGTMTGCTGDRNSCKLLEGAAFSVTQDAHLFVAAPPGPDGAFLFAGPVAGIFAVAGQLGNKTHTLGGSYNGSVSGTLTPLPQASPPPRCFCNSGANNSAWQADFAIGRFNRLKKASGTVTATLGGVFPGGERISGTIQGSRLGD